MKGKCVLNVRNISSDIRLILFVVNIPTCVIATVGNLVVLSVILANRELRTRPNLLICCLAVTDLAVGILLQPLLSVHLWFDLYKDGCFMEDAVYFLTSVVCGASCLTLVLISVDRYLHLVKLLKYQSIMTKRRLRILAVSCWLVPIVEGCFLFDYTTVNVFFILVILSTFCDFTAMCICYSKIYSSIRAMSKLRSALGGSESDQRSRLNTNAKLAKCFFTLVASFVLLWLPLKTVLIYITVASISGKSFSELSPNVDTLHCCAIMIGICNSSLNPLIYFWKNKALKRKTKGVLLSMICKFSYASERGTEEKTEEDTSHQQHQGSAV